MTASAMARFSVFLAVVTGLIGSSVGSAIVEPRAILPPLPTPAQIITALTSLGVIKDINIFITPQSFVTNTVSMNFDVQNLLPLELTFDQIAADTGINGTTFATFSHSFPSPGLVIPPLGTLNSGNISNVALPQGVLATLGVIPGGVLDLSNLNASARALTINGIGGLPIPLSGLSQSSVPTTWTPNPADLANTLSTASIIKDITGIFTLQTLVTNLFSMNFGIQNPLPFEITFDQLATDAKLNGTTYASFTHSFPSPGFVIPAFGTQNTGNINNIPLLQGVLATLGIVPAGVLDLSSLSASVRALSISGVGGIPIPLSGLSQTSVPTDYINSILSDVSPAIQPRTADASLDLPLSISQIIDLITSIGLIKDINIIISLTSLITNTVSMNFDIINPLPIELTLDQIGANAGLNGTTYATFSHAFASPGLVIPPLGTANSGTIDNVALPQGALATLGIIPFGKLDLSSLNASVRALSISGVGGIPIPLAGLLQSSVPTTYSGAAVPGLPILGTRDIRDILPPLTPGQIVDLFTSVGLIKDITIFITLQSLLTNTVSMTFDIVNPLIVELSIDQIAANAGLNGTVFATFSHAFPSPGLVIPPLSTVNSGTIDNVALPKGALATLGIIPSGELDLSNLTSTTRVFSISGIGGLPIPLSGLVQSSVPTNYSLNIV